MASMNPEKANEGLKSAIEVLEAGESGAGKAAFDFLKNVPDEYSLGTASLRAGLKSANSDVTVVCALALGRFGRGIPEVRDELAAILKDPARPLLCASAAASALAMHKTRAAAEALADSARAVMAADGAGDSRVTIAMAALGSMGAVAAAHLELFPEIRDQLNGRGSTEEAGEVQNTYREFGSAIRSAYLTYRSEQAGYRPPMLRLGLDTGECESTHEVGQWSVVFDGRCEYGRNQLPGHEQVDEAARFEVEQRWNSNSEEVRLVVFRGTNDELVCCAVWDAYSGNGLMNRFESFASGVLASFATMRENGQLPQFLLVQPSSIGRDGAPEITGIEMSCGDENGVLNVTEWTDLEALDDVFGESSAELLTYLLEIPQPPEGFVEYQESAAHDDFARRRYEVARAKAPEGRVSYAELGWDFAEEVSSIRAGGATSRELKAAYGDSLDGDQIHTDPIVVLPPAVSELLAEIHRVDEARADAREAFNNGEMDGMGAIPVGMEVPEIPAGILRSRREPWAIAQEAPTDIDTLDVSARDVGVVVLKATGSEGDMVVTNVPRTVFSGSIGYGWGYGGSGPHELALNILNYFVPPAFDGAPEVAKDETYWAPKVRTFASQTATELWGDFTREIVARIPSSGGFVSAERIKDWIVDKLASSRA